MPADLIVLVPDRNTEAAITGLLGRTASLAIRAVRHRILVHPERDPGVRLRGHEMLRIHQSAYRFGLVLFDREGCGAEAESRRELEQAVENDLDKAGWVNRAAAVVFDPELETLVWSDSPRVDGALGWTGRQPLLRRWLESRGFEVRPNGKPARPKEALEAVLREVRRPRASSLFEELAGQVSLERCLDPAFLKLKTVLRRWFGTASDADARPA